MSADDRSKRWAELGLRLSPSVHAAVAQALWPETSKLLREREAGRVENVDLGEWPRLIVVGQPVTTDQAAEIIVRTDAWHLTSNDRDWARQVADVVGVPLNEHGFLNWEQTVRLRERLRVVDLHYLHNARIMSSWIGGPHGWIDWNGAVGCTSWNIGKWPDVDDVLEDLKAIAAAWPFLDFAAQIVADDGDGAPVINFRVGDGAVFVRRPEGYLASPSELCESDILGIFIPGGERGCTIAQLRRALALVSL